MGRRFWGIYLLATAVLLALVLPRVIDPGEPGTASRAPDPPPPAVGACLLLPENNVVDCAAPHSSEVVLSWPADDPELPGPADDGNCNTASLEYLGMRPAGLDPLWESMVPFQGSGLIIEFGGATAASPLVTSIYRAPGRERLQTQGWKVCTLALQNPPATVIGSLKDLAQQPDRPDMFGACANKEPSSTFASSWVYCSEPHQIEVLGQVSAMIYDDPSFPPSPELDPPLESLPSEAEIQAECLQLAKALTLTENPTFGGTLILSTEYQQQRTNVGDSGGAANMAGDYLYADCSLITAQGELLIDSLVGIGTKPLPVR